MPQQPPAAHETFISKLAQALKGWDNKFSLLPQLAKHSASYKAPFLEITLSGCFRTWRARTALDWKRRSVLKSWAISRTSLWNGSLRMSSSVDFWYLRISRRATVPGLYLQRWGPGLVSYAITQ